MSSTRRARASLNLPARCLKNFDDGHLGIIFLFSHGVRNDAIGQPLQIVPTWMQNCRDAPHSSPACNVGPPGRSEKIGAPDKDPYSEMFRGLFRNLTNGHMLQLAGLIISSLSGVIINIIKSNLLFGLLLSSVQLSLVVLLIAVMVALVIVASGRSTRNAKS